MKFAAIIGWQAHCPNPPLIRLLVEKVEIRHRSRRDLLIGCVNYASTDGKGLFNWAEPQINTRDFTAFADLDRFSALNLGAAGIIDATVKAARTASGATVLSAGANQIASWWQAEETIDTAIIGL